MHFLACRRDMRLMFWKNVFGLLKNIPMSFEVDEHVADCTCAATSTAWFRVMARWGIILLTQHFFPLYVLMSAHVEVGDRANMSCYKHCLVSDHGRWGIILLTQHFFPLYVLMSAQVEVGDRANMSCYKHCLVSDHGPVRHYLAYSALLPSLRVTVARCVHQRIVLEPISMCFLYWPLLKEAMAGVFWRYLYTVNSL